MKKAIVCIIIFLMAMSLCACTDSVREDTGGDTDIGGLFWDILHDVRGDEPDNTETGANCFDLVGPWHIDQEKTDISAIEADMETFPGYAEWGASMEIRSNGQMSWYIGAVGGSGTYTIEDDVLHAELTDSMEQKELTMDFQIVGKDAIKMTYANTEIIWAYGDQEDIPANGD